MSVRSAIARLLTALAVIGLLAGTFAVPATARAAADATVDQEAAAERVAAMPDDMPCCDPEPSGPDCRDTKACPFAAACAAKIMPGIVPAPSAIITSASPVPLPVRQDRLRPSLAAAPQGPPPKPRS